MKLSLSVIVMAYRPPDLKQSDGGLDSASILRVVASQDVRPDGGVAHARICRLWRAVISAGERQNPAPAARSQQ
jgi:hypothetical protein